MLQLNYLSTLSSLIFSSIEKLKKATNHLKILPALIFGAVFFIGAASNISAQSFTVDHKDDTAVIKQLGSTRTLIVTKIEYSADGVCDEDCSMFEALSDANSTPTDEIIIFNPAVFDTGVPINLGFGDGSISNNGRLTINGPGMNKLILSTGFHISTNAWLTVSNLTIRQRSINRGTFILNNVTIRDSLATQSGGAIYNYASLTINNSVIRDNTARDSGGGIFTDGVVTIYNSLITNNSAVNEGGGIRGRQVDIFNSVISNNSAADGGGIFCVYGSV